MMTPDRNEYIDGYRNGYIDGLKEAIEWCMAFRRDDGTAQKIEAKLNELIEAMQ